MLSVVAPVCEALTRPRTRRVDDVPPRLSRKDIVPAPIYHGSVGEESMGGATVSSDGTWRSMHEHDQNEVKCATDFFPPRNYA